MLMKTKHNDKTSRRGSADLLRKVCGFGCPYGRTADLEKQVCATGLLDFWQEQSGNVDEKKGALG